MSVRQFHHLEPSFVGSSFAITVRGLYYHQRAGSRVVRHVNADRGVPTHYRRPALRSADRCNLVAELDSAVQANGRIKARHM